MKYLGFDDIESLDEAISCGGIDMRQGDQWVIYGCRWLGLPCL